jgi:hypothetical protein
MQWTDVIKPPPAKTLRQFGMLSLVVFGGLAAWQTWNGNTGTGTMVLWGAAAVIGGLGLVAPAAVKPIYVAWMVVAFPIGWTVSKVVLAAMLYLVFTPMALVFRLIGRDALDMRLRRPAGESYWKAKQPARSGDEYLRQF